jgi:hypothetical protein
MSGADCPQASGINGGIWRGRGGMHDIEVSNSCSAKKAPRADRDAFFLEPVLAVGKITAAMLPRSLL